MFNKSDEWIKDELTCVTGLLDRLDKKLKKENSSEITSQETGNKSDGQVQSEKEDIVIRIRCLLTWYIKKAAKAKTTYYRCSLLIIGIPLIVAVVNTAKIVPGPFEAWITVLITALSGLTSFISGWLILSRCQENWIRYRNCAEDIKDELDLYLNDTGIYTLKNEKGEYVEKRSSQILAEQIRDITQKERKQWTDMRNSPDIKNNCS